MYPTKGIVILCYVDDFLALGESEAEIKKALKEVSLKVKLQELGEVSTFLGIQFSLQSERGSNKGPVGPTNRDPTKGYKSLILH